MTPANRTSRLLSAWGARSAATALVSGFAATAALAATPQIRASAANAVPQCVTPERLMAFLKSRNPAIDPRFSGIAALYKRHGEAWRVRWDYAFFQMAVETNFLSFKRGDGNWGDVKPRQNNFAGLGTTGGGVPGDSYPDVGTGVLAQIQHLVVYSGEAIADPVGPRTRLKQDDILESTAHLKGRTTFADLSRRWAADRHYGAAIEWVAGSYRATYCTKAAEKTDAKPKPLPNKPPSSKTMLASAHATLPPASALGGPGAKEGERQAPPVRTIWSRSEQTDPAKTKDAEPKPAPTAASPSPTAPAEPQPVQPPASTGSSDPKLEVASQQRIVVPSPVEVTPASRAAQQPEPQPLLQPASESEPKAFAFAAAMVAASAAPAPETARCRVFSASYGGTKTLLVRAEADGELRYTALTVLEGFEDSMLAGYTKAHAPGGTSLGTFDSQDAALTKAGELCPGPASEPGANTSSAG